jgi:methylaspartate mutase sigma subunit
VTRLRTVILGVCASDAHAVANRLIEYSLTLHGFNVVNLGTCTPVSEFRAAVAERPDAEAVLIGSLNGHVLEDLADLPAAVADGSIPCPVIVGGNLSVGNRKTGDEVERLLAIGVDHVLEDMTQLPPLLDRLREARFARAEAGY